MSGPREGICPPKLAEWLLSRIVGTGPGGRSILGDAREELASRGDRGSRWAAELWYWGYVLRFAVTYRSGGREPRGRGLRGLGWDFRRSVRVLVRQPWMSLAVVGTLAVGLGATTLAYAVMDGVLLRPLPYPAGEELVDISRVDPEWFGGPPSAANAGNVFATPPATFFDWQRMARSSFTAMGAYAVDGRSLTGAGEPLRVLGAVTTSGVFAALGVPPLIGRHLLSEDDAIGAPPVLVLSHGFWLRRFGGDPGIVGRQVYLDGIAHTIIGVMPQGFFFPVESADFWVGFDDDARTSTRRNAGYLHAVARLAPGASVRQARAEMTEITARLAQVEPEERDFEAHVFSFHELLTAGVRPGIVLLLCAAAVVLLVGSTNVTNMLLSRVTERRREFAVHAALGAGRGRLAGLVLWESLTLAVIGGLAGFVLTLVGLRPFLSVLPMVIPRAGGIAVDHRVLMVTLAVSVVTGLLLAALPAVRSGSLRVNAVLRDGGHGATGGRSSARARGLLVVSEVALAVLLLSVSGLFVQSFLLSIRQDRGFDAEDLLTMQLSLPSTRATSIEDVRSFFSDLLERVRAIPGVTEAGLGTQMPLVGGYSSPPASVETVHGIEEAIIHTSVVTPSYFAVMGIPVISGRGLLPTDRAGTVPVVVVSEAMARRFWPGESAIGKRVRLDDTPDAAWREVVGVVGSVRYSFAADQAVEYYRPWAQNPIPYAVVVMKALPGARGAATAIVRAVHDIEPTLPVTVTPMTERAQRDQAFRWARVASLILTVLAGTATLLAILGVYSVLAYGVVQRTREIGIRVSLGGTHVEILRAVLGRGLLMAAIGAVLGLALATGTGTVVRSALVGVSPADQWVLVGVTGVVIVTAAIASLVPALRAVRVDPLVALRGD